MAVDDRKKRILEHLKQSTDGMQYVPPKPTSEPPPTPSPTPIPQPTPTPLGDDRKRRIMNHVNSSSGDFGDFSLTDKNQKKKIENHIRKSLN
ncbi:hypothetical protein VB715_17130 [Crocosphaera sp. UHCC 0190]|uniref:hypothetical protein n=1 Tax=Crocosphaera sp. UHCC 0190 TaxID=3110246 RepID=UPI002B1F1AC1|nr:hypothetical protein [Crocosphaera sp. UHCC 0190]MEA5511498.1 hypothetical protein [Crocosphaera sp. UHCC 0190]